MLAGPNRHAVRGHSQRIATPVGGARPTTTRSVRLQVASDASSSEVRQGPSLLSSLVRLRVALPPSLATAPKQREPPNHPDEATASQSVSTDVEQRGGLSLTRGGLRTVRT